MTNRALAFNQFSCRGLVLGELTELCADAGFQGLGLLIECVRELGPTKAHALLRNAGLHPTSLGVEFGVSGVDLEFGVFRRNQVLEAVEFAAELNVPLVIVLGGLGDDRTRSDALAQETEALMHIAERAVTIGARIAVEPLHPMYVALTPLTSVHDAIAIARSHPAIGVVVDTWHVIWSEVALERELIDVRPHLDVVHLSGAERAIPLSEERVMPGEGLPGLVDACASLAIDTDAVWEVEVFRTRATRGDLLRRPLLAARSARKLWSAIETTLEKVGGEYK
ncbi:TIM barrel protein [Microbacterium sp. A8/3-1]|uniref:TIM barrel protein n=1 Tax=Microbacterium sp. A8/3-1 TaxID=3160749 RepID=A0AAU7W0K0_9MICO